MELLVKILCFQQFGRESTTAWLCPMSIWRHPFVSCYLNTSHWPTVPATTQESRTDPVTSASNLAQSLTPLASNFVLLLEG